VADWRRGDSPPEPLVNVRQHDHAGRLVAQRDPRFLTPTSRPNERHIYSLSEAVLFTDSRDAGWRLGLSAAAGQQQEYWDGRGSYWINEYDDQRRPIAVHEQTREIHLRTIERLTYADDSAEFAERNQCGSLIRHDDSAGTVWFRQVALNGGLVCQTRRFLPDQAGLSANWPAYLASGAQPMTWDARNQLHSVINVQRSTGINDGEWYRYSAAGERVVKFSTRQAHTVTHQEVVHYLPGLEVRTADEGEELQVIHVQLARGSVRCLHWVNGPPDGIDNDQLRYSIDDHPGNSSLELDQLAAVISHEGYYP
jgi:uncharacterized protein RhaS with RHS repeats